LRDGSPIRALNGRANSYANFPPDHPLYLGMGRYQAVEEADVILLMGGRAPWYPPRRRPTRGKIVAIGDNPHRGDMIYQSLHADIYLEGDAAETIKLLTTAMKSMKVDANAVSARRQRFTREHEDYAAGLRAERAKAQNGGLDPLPLLRALHDLMPAHTT